MRISTDSPQASLIMPTWNRRARLIETIGRIVDTPGPDVEIIVADNASSDGGADEAVRRFRGVRVVPLNANRESAARNEAARVARAPILIMLDDDSYPEPGAVERMIEALTDAQLGIAAAWVKLPDGTWEEGGAPCVHVGCGAAIRRNLFAKFGGYPEIYGTYVEEYDLAFQVLAAGYDVRFIDGCVVRHEPQARASFDFMIERLTANNVYLGWRFFPDGEAQAFEDWIVYRYGVFARERNAAAGYARAVAALDEKRAAGLRDRFELPEHVLDRVQPRRIARRGCAHFGTGSHVAFVRAGKEIADLIAGARDTGCVVDAIYDGGLLAPERDVNGVPIRPVEDLKTHRVGLLVGGLSPGFIENTRQLAERMGVGPLIALTEKSP